MKTGRSYIVCLALIWLMLGCEEEVSIIQNKDLVFTHSYPVRIPPYEYEGENGQFIQVRGDSGFESNSIDTLSGEPVLAWEGLENQLVSVAIFTEAIEVAHGEIIASDVIWKWNTGMAAADSNRIAYAEGRAVSRGDYINEGQVPDPLPPGHYYWAVWSWGKSGTTIIYSSRQLEFYVPN
ncbi:MAG: hypothetical protein JW801_08775 [Bacteroidales bacterium]|nr:hypothetical protein [Bacteroidales bacterium]